MTICKKCKEYDRYIVAGQSFRDFTCALCGGKDVWHNTNVPKFCEACSKKFKICQRCGASLDEEKKQEESGR